jgi:hypothetical protein
MATCDQLYDQLRRLQNLYQHVHDPEQKAEIAQEIGAVEAEIQRMGCRQSIATAWAVLLCKFKDEPPNDSTDLPTPIETFKKFFTTEGAGTFNAVRYFSDMSHGLLDLSGSQVFDVILDANFHDYVPPSNPPPTNWKAKYDEYGVLELARRSAKNAGVSLENFLGDILTSNRGIFPTHGGIRWSGITKSNRPFVFGDHRYVQNNGTQSFGHEMGHGYGLDHSRADDPNVNILGCDPSTRDYRDPWDKMSAACDFSGPDPNYQLRGPGFNAWNMRGRGWLDEARVWRAAGDVFDQTVPLRPLHRRDLGGFLAAELPPNDGIGGHGRYLVEFRMKEEWDVGIPKSAVLAHRFEGNQSYIMSGIKGQLDLAAGDVFAAPILGGVGVEVLAIDENAQTATVRLFVRRNGLGMIVYAPQPDGSYKAAWGSGDIGEGSDALAWLPVTMNGDGKTQVVQLWNHP